MTISVVTSTAMGSSLPTWPWLGPAVAYLGARDVGAALGVNGPRFYRCSMPAGRASSVPTQRTCNGVTGS
jgi:hypothetical protein